MSKNLLILVVAFVLVAAVGAAGWYAFQQYYPKTKTPTTTVITSPVYVSPTGLNDAPEACKVVTSSMIQTQLGLSVGAGTSAPPSYLQGSTCSFKSNDATASVIVVKTSNDPAMNYLPDFYKPNTKFTDIGDKAFIQAPTAGNSNAAFVKKGKMVLIGIYTKGTYTTDQVKALLIASAATF